MGRSLAFDQERIQGFLATFELIYIVISCFQGDNSKYSVIINDYNVMSTYPKEVSRTEKHYLELYPF